ncbi:MAG: hypothetical protein AAGI07_00655 [Bacteroidota bacterium]
MKKFLNIIKWIFLSISSLLLIVFLLLLLDRDYQPVTEKTSAQKNIKVQKVYSNLRDSSLYYSLLKEYGKNKKLAEDFELQCLLALSHYPELKDIPIDFAVHPAFLPLASRPDPLTVLLPWLNRKYLVIISNASADFFEPILLHNTPFNEQVGIIGHELGHTVYYLDKSALELAIIAYRYEYDNEFHHTFERETDKRAVAHGLGYQLYDFAYFVRRAFGDTEEEIENETGGTYLSPKEVLAEMKRYDFYPDTLNHASTLVR